MFVTPLTVHPQINDWLGINLRIKRDDLYPIIGGGSKGRKADYIFNSNVVSNFNAVVTAGSNQSNHLRATAVKAAEYGMKMIAIIHDEEPEIYSGNLKIIQNLGAELRFVDMKNVTHEMDKAMLDLRKLGYKPYYIWGGGHNVDGCKAYYYAVEELISQVGNDPIIDFIYFATGTGATHAGLHLGFESFSPNTKVVGVSVSRPKQRGVEIISESMNELAQYLKTNSSRNEINFSDEFVGKGYGSKTNELELLIAQFGKMGLILDPVYTGKAMLGLIKHIEMGLVPKNSNVVFWHTGGLMNFLTN